MIIHNIYIINSDGICPLNMRLGSIDADPEMVAGIFTASQKFWGHLTGEEPQLISFQNIRAHMKQFSTGEKTWYLVIILELENPELLKTVEKRILEVIISNKDTFEKFIADTNEISLNVQNQIIKNLQSIPCPYLKRKIFVPTCQVNSNIFKMHKCNVITMSACKEKIKEQIHCKSKNVYISKFPKIY